MQTDFAGEVRYVPVYNEECGYKLLQNFFVRIWMKILKLVVLIDPLNPLGSGYTEEEIKEFAEIAIENDIYLLDDVTYKDFARNHYLAAGYAANKP